MTVDFSQHFWDTPSAQTQTPQKPSPFGLEVLLQTTKHGVATTREVADFLKEHSAVEESHSKALSKLAKVANNGCPSGSFAPMWVVLKNFSEKLAAAHSQMVGRMEGIVREVLKYSDDLQKQYKSVKDTESSTLEAVQAYQTAKVMVARTKAAYLQRYLDLEKCHKESLPQKEVEKAQGRVVKAQEEYKGWIEKSQVLTEDYVGRMTESCGRFQSLETAYLEKMKDFIDSYATIMDTGHQEIAQVHTDFRDSTLSVEELLVQMVQQRGTGGTRPGTSTDTVDDSLVNLEISQNNSASSEDKSLDKVITNEKIFEGMTTSTVSMPPPSDRSSSKGSRRTTSLLNLFIPSQSQNQQMGSKAGSPTTTSLTGDVTTTLSRTSKNRGSKWFLRSRRGKKPKKDQQDTTTGQGSEEPSPNVTSENGGTTTIDPSWSSSNNTTDTSSPKVDAEGFTIRPKDVWEEQPTKFYSSSDTDSDSEPEKRLHVEIKPLTNGTAPLSASVDELRSTVENLTLITAGRKHFDENSMKRSASVSQQIGGIPSSPPAPSHPYAPLSPSSLLNAQKRSRYGDPTDMLTEEEPGGDTPPKTVSTTAIPRPASRQKQEMHQKSPVSPGPSPSKLSFGPSAEEGSSRGPSPLTFVSGGGDVESIPVAVAFHEIIHAYFRGSDEDKCQVKMTGDMMVSFPAGIIELFSSNNSPPPQLGFKITTRQSLERLATKEDLVVLKESPPSTLHFSFNMTALTTLLKSHAEQNPSASYFNIDIFKYKIKPHPGAASCPLHLVSFWKCDANQTDLRVDYKYNVHATEDSSSLEQVCIAAPVDGGVKGVQSKPNGQWFQNTQRICWKLPSLSQKSKNSGVGSLRARFEMDKPTSTRQIAAQFSCENATLSGTELEILGSGYRVSLVKKRYVSGKYICDASSSDDEKVGSQRCGTVQEEEGASSSSSPVKS